MMNPNRALVVCNAPLESVAIELLVEASRQPSTLIVGVDGGAVRLRSLGIMPHIVTGDFDSLTEADLAAFEATGANIIPTPDQDYTDFDKALSYVRELSNIEQIIVHGAVGGRLDHTYSVLSAVIKHGVYEGADIRLVDATGETFPVRNGELVLEGKHLHGCTLSLLAFGVVRGIDLSGVQWTLKGETLAPGFRDGTSNEIVADRVVVRYEPSSDSALLVQRHHAPHPPRQVAQIPV